MQNGGGKICSEVVGSGAFGTDAAGPWGCSCRLRSGVSPVPKCEGPGAPSARFLGRRDRGHPPSVPPKFSTVSKLFMSPLVL
jgi:hypothetical protein